jgi:hypothetical protein
MQECEFEHFLCAAVAVCHGLRGAIVCDTAADTCSCIKLTLTDPANCAYCCYCCCRLAGTRGAQLRQICNDLKKICQHPFMLPDFEPDRSPLPAAAAGTAAAGSSSSAGGAEKAPNAEQQQQAAGVLGASVGSDEEYLAALVASSGKLQLLDQMLHELRGQGKQVLVLAHAPKVRPGVYGSRLHAMPVCAYA